MTEEKTSMSYETKVKISNMLLVAAGALSVVAWYLFSGYYNYDFMEGFKAILIAGGVMIGAYPFVEGKLNKVSVAKYVAIAVVLVVIAILL